MALIRIKRHREQACKGTRWPRRSANTLPKIAPAITPMPKQKPIWKTKNPAKR